MTQTCKQCYQSASSIENSTFNSGFPQFLIEKNKKPTYLVVLKTSPQWTSEGRKEISLAKADYGDTGC